MNKTVLIIGLILLGLCLCVCGVFFGGSWLLSDGDPIGLMEEMVDAFVDGFESGVESEVKPTYTVEPSVVPTEEVGDVPLRKATFTPIGNENGEIGVVRQVPLTVNGLSAGEVTLNMIGESEIPPLDLAELYYRLGWVDEEIIYPTAPLKIYEVGDRRDFEVCDDDECFDVEASLDLVSTHVYFWIEDGISYKFDDLKSLANEFEDSIYPLNQELFGSEWSPGIDGDPRIVILYAKDIGETRVGYFSADDEMHEDIIHSSNMAEMFVFGANSIELWEDYTKGVLAHEYEHMIHWNADKNEPTWMDEGFAEMAVFLGGYSNDNNDFDFLRRPDLQLNRWSADDSLVHYGASFSFVQSIYDRLGAEIAKEILHEPLNGFDGIDAVLTRRKVWDDMRGRLLTADDLVQDWMITNLVLNNYVSDGRFGYTEYVNAPQAKTTRTVYPADDSQLDYDVHQYGADYLEVYAADGFQMHFDGENVADLLPVEMMDGEFGYWSNQESLSNSRLTREFDFSKVAGTLTLTFSTWFDMEDDYDYAFLSYSKDFGETWDLLDTEYGEWLDSDLDDYVWMGDSRRWLEEEVDLSFLAGEKVLLRFESIMDGSNAERGFVLDQLEIPEIGYATSFETVDKSWVSEGFVQVHPVVPQRFRVAAVVENRSDVWVEYLTLDAKNEFDYVIGAGEAEKVTFVISGATRYIEEKADYVISFE